MGFIGVNSIIFRWILWEGFCGILNRWGFYGNNDYFR